MLDMFLQKNLMKLEMYLDFKFIQLYFSFKCVIIKIRMIDFLRNKDLNLYAINIQLMQKLQFFNLFFN